MDNGFSFEKRFVMSVEALFTLIAERFFFTKIIVLFSYFFYICDIESNTKYYGRFE